MANPVIDSMIANPPTGQPHSNFVVTIVAHDPDQATGTLIGKVRDAAGNEAQASAIFTISDPITYELVVPTGYSFTPRAGQPGVFDCVAP